MISVADKKISLVLSGLMAATVTVLFFVRNGVFGGVLLLLLGVIFISFIMVIAYIRYKTEEFLKAGKTLLHKLHDFLSWFWTDWLSARIGDAPNAYWRLLTWFCLGVAILDGFSSLFLTVQDFVVNSEPLRNGIYLYVLPIALAGFIIYRLSFTTRPSRLTHPLATIFLAIAAAAMTVIAADYLLRLPSQIGGALTGLLNISIPNILSALSITLIILILALEYPPVGIGLKLFLIGTIAGLILSLTLSYPLFSWLYNNYIPGSQIHGSNHEQILFLCNLLAGIVALLIGPIVVWVVKPRTIVQKMFLGSVAGGIAGGYVFGLLGGPISGIIGQAVLLPIVISREGFRSDLYIYKIAQAVNNSFPWVVAATWFFIGGLAIIGALSTLLFPMQSAKHKTTEIPTWNSLLTELAWPGLFLLESLVFVVVAAVCAILPSLVQNVYDSFGIIPQISPATNFQIIIFQHWVLILLLQFFALSWIRRRIFPFKLIGGNPILVQGSIQAAYIFAGAGLMIAPLIFYIVPSLFDNPASQIFGIMSIALGLESLIGLIQLNRPGAASSIPSSKIEEMSKDFSEKSVWHAASLPLGFFATILNVQFLLNALSLVLVAVVLIGEITDVTSQPAGIEWLNQKTVLPLFQISSVAFLAMLVASLIMSLSGRDPYLLPKDDEEYNPQDMNRFRWPEKISNLLQPMIQMVVRLLGPTAGEKLLVVLILLAGYIIFVNPVFILLAVSYLIVSEMFVRRLQTNALLASFLITLISLLVLAHDHSTLNSAIRLVFNLAFATGAVISYQAIQLYSPDDRRPFWRQVALIGVLVSFTLVSYFSQFRLQKQGGIAVYDGQGWNVYSRNNGEEDAMIVGVANYSFFQDSRNRLWFGSGTGAVIEKDSNLWNAYLLGSPSEIISANKAQGLLHAIFLEDRQGLIWVADGWMFGLLDEEYRLNKEDIQSGNSYSSLLKPTNALEETLELKEPVIDGISDTKGNLWLLTNTSIIQVIPTGTRGQAEWTSLTIDDGLLSVYFDHEGRLWVGAAHGIYLLEEGKATLKFSNNSSPASKVVFQEDTKGDLWLGINPGGLFIWQNPSGGFKSVDNWPLDVSVNTFFMDDKGILWAGTDHGVYRIQGGKWTDILQRVVVNKIVQDAAGNLWVGGQQGLVKIPDEGGTVVFDTTNSGLTDDQVHDLMVDSSGNLWTSSYSETQTQQTIPWIDTLVILFFGVLFYLTRNRYEKSPATRARRLAEDVLAEPDRLLPMIYQMDWGQDGGINLASELALQLERNQDLHGAHIARSFAEFQSQGSGNGLKELAASLEVDEIRKDSLELSRFYSIAACLQEINNVPQIADTDLMVNPANGTNSISIHSPKSLMVLMPGFMAGNSEDVWRELEKTASILKKYIRVDQVTDRLGYLTQALESLDRSQSLTREIPFPDRFILQGIIEKWRSLAKEEIDQISGRAEIKIELLTRQIHAADLVTAVFRLQNIGRAAAENLHVTLTQAEGYSIHGDGEVGIERLSSGSSQSVEFKLALEGGNQARLVCRLDWDDRMGAGHQIEFADVLSLYQTSQDFKRIPNPYVVGHPLKNADLFQGREDVFDFIRENLGGAVSDRTLILYGQRRTGKTSVLYQLLAGRLGEKFIPILIDMQEIAALVSNNADLLGEIAYQIVRTLGKAGIKADGPAENAMKENPVRAFNRFIDHLETILQDRRLILMFDEFELIEQKIVEGRVDVNLLDYFRSLMQHREHLVFIFTGTHRLEEMSHEYWSILFNIALYRRINFLDTGDARKLIRKPVSDYLSIDDLVVEKITDLTSGHPYFTQLICWALVNHCNDRQRNYATINDINDVIEEILTTGKAHFAYIWHQSAGNERLVLAGIAHLARSGRSWVRPDEILDLLEKEGAFITHNELIAILDRFVSQEVLEQSTEGYLRYRFEIELLRLWIDKNNSVTSLIEKGSRPESL